MTNLPATVDHRSLPDLMKLGAVLSQSGYFADARQEAQAVAKVLAGHELGIPPIAAMTGIHIVKGKVTLGANLIAAQIRRSTRYDYEVVEMTPESCQIRFVDIRGGEPVSLGVSQFTMDDAKAAGLVRSDSPWQGHRRNMLFARAMSNGAKWYCPDVFAGPVYTPDEMGASVDYETGEVIELESQATGGTNPTPLPPETPEVPSESTPSPAAGGRPANPPAPPQPSVVPGGESRPAAEVSHLVNSQTLYRTLFKANGLEVRGEAVDRMGAALKAAGILDLDQLRLPTWWSKAEDVARDVAASLQPSEPKQLPGIETVIAGTHAVRFISEADGTWTAIYEMPSDEDANHLYRVAVSNTDRHSCECNHFTKGRGKRRSCKHIERALDLLAQDVVADDWVGKRFGVLAALSGEPVDDGNEAADRAAEKAGLVPVPGGEAA